MDKMGFRFRDEACVGHRAENSGDEPVLILDLKCEAGIPGTSSAILEGRVSKVRFESSPWRVYCDVDGCILCCFVVTKLSVYTGG